MPSTDPIVLMGAVLSGFLVAVLLDIKWVRVAQRVHYLPREVARVQRLWFERRPLGALWWLAGALLAIASVQATALFGVPELAWLAVAAPLMILPTPWRLPFRGVTSPLAWTPRARRAFAAILLLQVAVGALSVWLFGPAGVLVPLLFTANLFDLALGFLWYLERRLTQRFVQDARRKLKRIHPRVVAITGSYGKTSTKGYVAHLVGGTHQTVASPASFNNLMGLSRTINEHLVVGTSVFVAEMGMNQEGRIRELSQLFPPDIAAITVIGEAHMERLGSQEAIFRAKAEITEKAGTVVLPVDQPELARLAEKCQRQGKTVITVSATGKKADIMLDPQKGTLRYGPTDSPSPIEVPPFGHAINIAVALGIAWALEVPKEHLMEQLGNLPVAAHRAEIQPTGEGVWIIDDTYNSNPVGAQHAVNQAAKAAATRSGPLVVVTPGMVELGPVQFERNRQLAKAVLKAKGQLMIVGRTNRAALLEGAKGVATVFDTRGEAVTAALHAAGDKGVILYENDLPDHYP